MMNKQKDNRKPNTEVFDALQQIKDVPALSPAAQREMRNQFIDEIVEFRKESVTFSKNLRLNKQILNRQQGRSVALKFATILLVVTLLIGALGTGTVLASQSALPDETLYPIKIWSEDFRLNLANKPEKKMELHLTFADHRVEEMVQLLEQGIIPDETLKQEILEHYQQAEQLIENCEDSVAAEEQIRAHLAIQEQVLAHAPEHALMAQTHAIIRQQLHILDCRGNQCEEENQEDLEEDKPGNRPEDAGNEKDKDHPSNNANNPKENGEDCDLPGNSCVREDKTPEPDEEVEEEEKDKDDEKDKDKDDDDDKDEDKDDDEDEKDDKDKDDKD